LEWISFKDSPKIRRRVGYLSQNPRFYDRMTAREVLRFTMHFFFKGPADKIENRITEMIELVELQDKADRAVGGSLAASDSAWELHRLK
jgi:ABC-2 type transport system ATP-binding protein